MRNAVWLPLPQAITDLARSKLALLVGDPFLALMQAQEMCLNALRCAKLIGRPANASVFTFKRSHCVSRGKWQIESVNLAKDGTIPLGFWHSFDEACTSDDGTEANYAALIDGCVTFRTSNNRGEVFTFGYANEIEIWGSPPWAPARGRRRGSSSLNDLDLAVARRAVDHMRATHCKRRSAAKRFVGELEGHGGQSSEANLARLIRKMKRLIEIEASHMGD